METEGCTPPPQVRFMIGGKELDLGRIDVTVSTVIVASSAQPNVATTVTFLLQERSSGDPF